MNDATKALLEKYNPENLLQPVLEHYNPASIRGGSFVVIDPKALKNLDVARSLRSTRGEEFFANLVVLAKSAQPMFVSALKSVKPSSAYIADTSPNNFEEADLVVQKVPGFYAAPITVPTVILKTIVAPNDIHGHPIPDEFNQKSKETRGDTLDNEYNKGKQPKGTRTKGGNN